MTGPVGVSRSGPEGRVARSGGPDGDRGLAGWIDYAAWLSEDVVILVGWFDAPEDGAPELHRVLDGGTEALDANVFSFPRDDTPLDAPRAGKVVTARLPRPSRRDARLGRLMIGGERPGPLGPSELARTVTDLRTLALGGLLSIEEDVRARLLAFLADAPVRHGAAERGRGVFRRLAMLHELLRPRRPVQPLSRETPRGLVVDELLAVDEGAFFVRGWLRDREAAIEELALVAPEGARVSVLDRAFRHARPDVERFYGETPGPGGDGKPGFLCYFETDVPGVPGDGWRVEMRNSQGRVTEAPVSPVRTDPRTVRDTLLAQAGQAGFPDDALLSGHVRPALDRLQRRLLADATLDAVTDLGPVPLAPDVSIVVPLYRRIDFLEHQLAQFVHDPAMAEAELIYVLDSPEQAEELSRSAWQLHELYRLPFRVATLTRNAGFAVANNVGASLARGRLLLLLNSDVLPEAPGWLAELVAFHDATPGIGAVAPKLLFEDGSLQHAGLYFRRLPGSSVWENAHYFKGLERDLPEANVRRRVPAVSAACLLMERHLYERVGGLRGEFVQGDYEDSDLCLRLRESGREIWYLPEVALHHLEGQSYPSELRRLTSRYNAWLHTRLWGDAISELTRDGDGPDSRAAAAPSARRVAAVDGGEE